MAFDTAHAAPDTFLTLAKGIVATQQAARDRHFTGGVSWSALTPTPPEVETVEDCAARLARIDAAHRHFLTTPRGRFLACVDELEALGFGAEVYKLRALYHSSITTLNGAEADQAAVGAAILVLNGIGTSVAKEGIDSLGELLVAGRKVAA